eukprot:comp23501_c0_seq1/m.39363 comp23501_c0_seq1/g.39363  ORF comp23501_c0_seq1/g.39363 comp23501_c0_seq1/m.39363 type:complete len:676 (-) comp23501_c0_seq1:179-2206(-)
MGPITLRLLLLAAATLAAAGQPVDEQLDAQAAKSLTTTQTPQTTQQPPKTLSTPLTPTKEQPTSTTQPPKSTAPPTTLASVSATKPATTSTSKAEASVEEPAPGECNPFPNSANAIPQFVTVRGKRFATLYNFHPSKVGAVNQPQCCPTHALPLPRGWALAPDSEESRLAAKMFPFGSDAVVFADGTGFITVDSGLMGPAEDSFVIARNALLAKDDKYTVDLATFPTMHWGGTYSFCARILITQQAGPEDRDYVNTNTSRVMRDYTTIDGTDYAAMDSTPPTLPWGAPEMPIRQEIAFTLPVGNWQLAGPQEARSKSLPAFGCGCLVAGDGTAYYTTNKEQCSTQALHGHKSRDGAWAVYWPSARLGSLRVLLTRKTAAVVLNTKQMKTLLLAPYSESDTILTYARKILDAKELAYDLVSVVTNGGQYARDLDLEITEAEGRRARYHTIVLTSDSLSYKRADGEWESGLPYQQWQRLRAYCAQYGVRTVSLFTFPNRRYGVSEIAADGAAEAKKEGYMWFMNKGPWMLQNVWRVPVKLDPRIPGPEPVVWFSPSADRKPTPDSDSVGGVKLPALPGERFEELHFFFASSADVPHGAPLGDAALSWATQSVLFNDGLPLSPAAIAGIVIGGIVGIGLLIYAVIKLWQRCSGFRRGGKDEFSSNNNMLDWNNAQSGY